MANKKVKAVARRRQQQLQRELKRVRDQNADQAILKQLQNGEMSEKMADMLLSQRAPFSTTSAIPGEANSQNFDELLGKSFETRQERAAYMEEKNLIDVHKNDVKPTSPTRKEREAKKEKRMTEVRQMAYQYGFSNDFIKYSGVQRSPHQMNHGKEAAQFFMNNRSQ